MSSANPLEEGPLQETVVSQQPTKEESNQPKLKLMLLNEFFYPDSQGGSGSATAYFSRRLAQEYNVDITTVTSIYAYRDESVKYTKYEEWLGIKIHRVSAPNWGRLKSIKRLVGNIVLTFSVAWKAIRLPKADVTLVVTNPMVLPMAAKIIRTVRGTPYVYMIYDLEPDRIVALGVKPADSRFVKLFRSMQKKWLHNATKVIAIGRCMRERLVTGYDLNPTMIDVVEIGADPYAVVPQGKNTKFRAKNNIEGFVVMYSGNFGRYHDFDTLLGAAEQLKSTHPDVRFVLVGRGFKQEHIENEIAKRELTNVKLYSFVPEEEFSDLLASADICMVTVEQGMEGVCVPGKFYSFLSSGRPVLALMGPESEVSLVVAENKIGYRVTVGDIQGFVAAILDGKANPQALDEMGKRARKIFDERYTADHVTQKMYETLAQAAKQP